MENIVPGGFFSRVGHRGWAWFLDVAGGRHAFWENKNPARGLQSLLFAIEMQSPWGAEYFEHAGAYTLHEAALACCMECSKACQAAGGGHSDEADFLVRIYSAKQFPPGCLFGVAGLACVLAVVLVGGPFLVIVFLRCRTVSCNFFFDFEYTFFMHCGEDARKNMYWRHR